jgi:fructokinase
MKSPKILVFGEALVDQFADSDVIGGAPFNLARHASSLLGDTSQAVRFISRVGDDLLGAEIKAQAQAHRLDPQWIQTDPVLATGVVKVAVNASGQPTYHIAQPAAWDAIEAPALDDVALTPQTIVCFNTLALRSAASRSAILASTDRLSACTRFVDINLRATGPNIEVIESVLKRSDWLKINDEELAGLTQTLDLAPSPPDAVSVLHARYGIKLTVVTRGAAGCWAFGSNDANSRAVLLADLPGTALERMVDTVGAGDGFSAAWLASSVLGADLPQSLRLANAYAAALCSHRGPVPASADRASFYRHWRSCLGDAIHPLHSAQP